MTANFFDRGDDTDTTLRYRCTMCGRERDIDRPGLSGGKLVAYCPKCDDSAIWDHVEDGDGTDDDDE